MVKVMMEKREGEEKKARKKSKLKNIIKKKRK
jgi:hypothetical protein